MVGKFKNVIICIYWIANLYHFYLLGTRRNWAISFCSNNGSERSLWFNTRYLIVIPFKTSRPNRSCWLFKRYYWNTKLQLYKCQFDTAYWLFTIEDTTWTTNFTLRPCTCVLCLFFHHVKVFLKWPPFTIWAVCYAFSSNESNRIECALSKGRKMKCKHTL